MGDNGECAGGCGPQPRPLVACDGCGRHVLRDAERCPFCARSGPSRLRGALVAAAFFGSAAIAGCAYGPPPDDFDSSDADAASEVQADGADEVNDSGADSELGANPEAD